MILGTGIDICSRKRMLGLLQRFPRLPQRLLGEQEQAEAEGLAAEKLAALLARRFAAKEALVKALGGASGLGYRDAQITHTPQGAPEFVLSARITSRLPANARLHLSISDERSYSLAMVCIEQPQ